MLSILIKECLCDSEDKSDAVLELQEELDVLKQSEQKLQNEVFLT